jgi:hypothetical protein
VQIQQKGGEKMPYIDGIFYEFDRAINAATIKRIAKSNKSTCIKIPDTVQGFTVKRIAESAFKGHVQLQEIELPVGLEIIGNFAFMNCRGLRNVTFRSTNVTLGQSTFENCVNLETVCSSFRLISLKFSSHSAFSHCSSLKTIDNIEFVGMIYDSSFYRCSSLTEISFGHNTEIKSGSLKGCRNLKTLRLDGNIAVPSKTMQKQLKAYKLICTEVTTILDWAYDGYHIEIEDNYLPF